MTRSNYFCHHKHVEVSWCNWFWNRNVITLQGEPGFSGLPGPQGPEGEPGFPGTKGRKGEPSRGGEGIKGQKVCWRSTDWWSSIHTATQLNFVFLVFIIYNIVRKLRICFDSCIFVLKYTKFCINYVTGVVNTFFVYFSRSVYQGIYRCVLEVGS